MSSETDVDVDPTHVVGVALGSGPAELPHNFAQVLDVLILQLSLLHI